MITNHEGTKAYPASQNKLGTAWCQTEFPTTFLPHCPRSPLGLPQLWKPDTWFSEHNLLTFLCAHDLAPIGKGIKVPCPRSNLEKWAPAIQVSILQYAHPVVDQRSLPACI